MAEAQLVDRPAPVIAQRWSQRHFRVLLAAIVVGGLVAAHRLRVDLPARHAPTAATRSTTTSAPTCWPRATASSTRTPSPGTASCRRPTTHPSTSCTWPSSRCSGCAASPATCSPRRCSARPRSWWPAWPGARSAGAGTTAGSGLGLVGALLVAVYPNTFRYDGMLLSESLVILTVLVIGVAGLPLLAPPHALAHGRGGGHGRAGRAVAQRAGAVRPAAGPAAGAAHPRRVAADAACDGPWSGWWPAWWC